ncbi:serine/threonine protein kinase [Nocardia stercoris]|uniref:Serine/threonine protein kinase n=2 Tax=Nocardia stercoris TaxID=2483361 RepID=A0A3M2LD26_9NOCA|nr:serine/threonine protein kinase [Nocardia stercoris]
MSNRTTYALGAVAVAVVVVLVAYFMHSSGGGAAAKVRDDGYGAAHDTSVSALLDSDGAIVLGKSNVKTIDVFEDPMCPSCGALEHIYGQEIAHRIDDGKLAVRYRLVNFLDPRSSSKDYSTRAIAANECVAGDGDGPLYSRFHQAMFTTEQPTEGGGKTDEQIAAVAKSAGASADVVTCITKKERVDTARAHADAALAALKKAAGDVATPTVLNNGKEVDVNDSDWVVKAAQ